MTSAVTRIVVASDNEDDPLETVRRAVAFCDAMVAEGATVTVTGDLSVNIRFEVPKPEDPYLQSKEPE